jgi:hypothetical protein
MNKTCLIFCSSKDIARKANWFLISYIPISGRTCKIVNLLLNELSQTPGGLDPIFEVTIVTEARRIIHSEL